MPPTRPRVPIRSRARKVTGSPSFRKTRTIQLSIIRNGKRKLVNVKGEFEGPDDLLVKFHFGEGRVGSFRVERIKHIRTWAI